MGKNLSEHLEENTADNIAETGSDTPVISQSGSLTKYVAPKSAIKGTVKDSVFRDLFENRKYALQLYKAIHPEDSNVTEADIGNVTINNVLTDQEYNDPGMTVRGKLLLLLEAQSTWSMNIIVRLLLYLAHTWNEHI